MRCHAKAHSSNRKDIIGMAKGNTREEVGQRGTGGSEGN